MLKLWLRLKDSYKTNGLYFKSQVEHKTSLVENFFKRLVILVQAKNNIFWYLVTGRTKNLKLFLLV